MLVIVKSDIVFNPTVENELMTRTSKIILATTLTLGLAGGVAAYGKYRFGDSATMAEHIAEHMVERVSDELELSDIQAQSLQALADELVKMKIQMKSELNADKQTIRDMVVADNFDQAKAFDLVTAKTGAIQNSAGTIIVALGTFLDGLTPEQKAEIAQHMDHHRHHGHRWGHGGGHSDEHRDGDSD